MKKFDEALKGNINKLKLFVPIVDRVHGEHHPEFHKVRALFDRILEKAEKDKAPDLESEFLALRNITGYYTVPDDVCESYEAVYNMLSELDRAYHEDRGV